ncbi:MAG: sigma-70 family RNA polymerase sigma factor [Spirochaetota bacterium]
MNKKNSDCIAQCYVLYGGYVKSIIAKFYSDRDEIEDIFHDVFLKMLHAGFYDNPHSFKTKNYIKKATRHICISRMRREIARQKYCNNSTPDSMIDIETITDVESKDIGDTVIDGMVVNTLYDIIDELEQEEQQLLFDKYFYNKKYVQLAAEQGVSYFFIKRKLLEVNKKIKQKLLNTCVY